MLMTPPSRIGYFRTKCESTGAPSPRATRREEVEIVSPRSRPPPSSVPGLRACPNPPRLRGGRARGPLRIDQDRGRQDRDVERAQDLLALVELVAEVGEIPVGVERRAPAGLEGVTPTPALWPFRGVARSKQATQFATAVDDGNDLDLVPAGIKFVQDQIVAFDEHA